MKTYFACSEQAQYKKRRKFRKGLNDPLNFLNKNGLSIKKIIIGPRNDHNQTVEDVNIEISQFSSEYTEDEQKIMAARAKDMANLSRRRYNIFIENLKWLSIPGSKAIASVQNIIDNIYTIHQNEKGLKFFLSHMF